MKRNSFFLVHIALLCMGILFAFQGSAQNFTQTRYEKEIKSHDYDFTVVPLSEKGIALLYNPDKYEAGKRIYEVTLLDADLQETWETQIKLEPSSKFIGYDYTPGMLYLLYRLGDTEFNDLYIVNINVDTHVIEPYTIKHHFNLTLSHFFMTGNSAVFGGAISKESSIIIFDLPTQRIKVVPGFFLHDSDLLDLRANQNNTFNALLLEHSSPSNTKLMLRTYDESGSLLLEDLITVDQDITILSGLTSSLMREDLMIAGFYGYVNNGQASGIYTVLIDPFTEQKIQYRELASISQFADYLGPKRAAKVINREKERKLEGKRPELKTYAMPIRLQEQSHGFLLLSEIYLPATTLNSGNTNSVYPGYGYTPYGLSPFMRGYGPYTSSSYPNTQNAEVRMLETFVTLFNDKGELIFDQSLPLKDVKAPYLDQASDFVAHRDKIMLGYKKDNDLFIKTGDVKYNEFETDTVKLKLKHESDVVHIEQDGDNNMRSWYGNNFYVFGRQSIKDKNKNDNAIRYVFFINKLEAK